MTKSTIEDYLESIKKDVEDLEQDSSFDSSLERYKSILADSKKAIDLLATSKQSFEILNDEQQTLLDALSNHDTSDH